MIIRIDDRDHDITCFHCDKDVTAFNTNDDLQCPDCKIVVSQAGIISAYEEYVTYHAAEQAKNAPPFAFTARP